MSVNKVNQTTGELSPIAGATYYSNIPIGSITPFGGSVIPNSFLLCNGQSILRTDYPELFTVIGTSFGSVDDTHFNVPDLRGKFVEGTPSDGTVGENKAAGLPNITGSVQFRGGSSYSELVGILNRGASSGSIYGADGTTGKYPSVVANTGTTNTLSQLNVDASRSSSIYGNSTTVQPPAVCVNYIIKATTIALPTDFANGVQATIEDNIIDSITDGSLKAVTSNAVYDALATKQNTLTFDTAPTSGSTNPVTSGGIYSAIQKPTQWLGLVTTTTSDTKATFFQKIIDIFGTGSGSGDWITIADNGAKFNYAAGIMIRRYDRLQGILVPYSHTGTIIYLINARNGTSTDQSLRYFNLGTATEVNF